MAKIDLDALSIDELASLRDRAIEKLAEKVAARQAELEAELERLSAYGGKPAKKAPAAPPASRTKKSEKSGEADQVKPQDEGSVAAEAA
jgi:hypothetical protein